MNNPKKWHTEKLSTRAFYVLIALSAMVFTAYWLVGYTRPFDDNPNFNAPLFTDAVILLTYMLTLLALIIAVWSMVRAAKNRGENESHDNNIPIKKISYSIGVSVVVLLAFTFLISSSSAITINDTKFTHHLWLKISDMFIYTSYILLGIAIGSVVYGATKYIRRK